MNKRLITGALLGILISVSSCDSMLDVDIKGQYTEENYFKNEQAVVDAVTGLYGIFIAEDFVAHGDYTWDIASDDVYRAGDHSEDEAIETFTFDASNPKLSEGWTWKYEMVSRSNIILAHVPQLESISAEVKSRSLGEAHFFRAFANWWLYLPYGEFPVITQEDAVKANYNKPKATIEEVMQTIEEDLKAAVELLPFTTGEGRVSKGAAWAYLTQLYMHWASYPNQDGKLDLAIATGEQIVGNNVFRLSDNFQDNFRQKSKPLPEMLLYVTSSQTWRSTSTINYFSPRTLGGWNFFHPMKSLYDAYGNDKRRIATIWADGDEIDLGDTKMKYEGASSETGYHFNKYTTFTPEGKLSFDLLIPLMRASDVYLLVAEAKIRKYGNGAGDKEINMVRARAGVDLVSNAGKEELMLERRLELAGENRRFFDLVRWDRLGWVDIASLLKNPDAVYHADLNRINFSRPKNYFFPLPQVEIDKSGGVLKQNSNY
ncbi:RagB/SusD family nutrient uptake outer membrane protein [Sphingobacterium sp. UT-1RO-CII-1]|uniref:RagB/SusD family nutrient uptake outer membrane protein n=1 Tax=Sphingobacterium sp. UT-1RO-CII-1 TaxID=2995225 RepID=UPI00227B943C|nr:RagB/SusD family nutrient uptake outer membrane protein [Sphingobacterium sp. UT-1RO-CII-1]MCY4779352.1 RagB/SusD family nutrient uptake outer membrane protein [Sphingobacterium sp. UT-1RO-CII-1]